jgi:integrase/recombinase XerD
MRDVSSLSIEEAFIEFINLKQAMNRAEETIKYYKDRFECFGAFLRTKNITSTNQINYGHIPEYILKLRKTNGDNSINNHLRAIRVALYYFMEKGYTEPFHIPLIAVNQTPKKGYEKEEIESLLKKPNFKKCSFSEYRNWVIICHWLASGIRSKTLRYIRNCHVDLKERIVTLAEVKNKEGYEMPISDEYYPILCEYMKIRGGEADEFLFCNQYGKQLSADGLRSVIYKYNKKHNVDKTSAHLFRSTFAKNWLLEGGSTKKLQHALGHKSSKMVDEYARLYGRELREEFSKFTPLAKMKDTISENKKLRMKKIS